MSVQSHQDEAGALQVQGRTFRFGRPLCDDGSVEWQLKRNCSMAPAQLFATFAGLCLVSLTIAGFFWMQGATVIMTFAWIELVAVGTALLIYSRHATDHEDISLHGKRLTVHHTSGARVSSAEFSSDWVTVVPGEDGRALIGLIGQGQRIEVGRFIRPESRQQLANELRWALRLATSRPIGDRQPADTRV